MKYMVFGLLILIAQSGSAQESPHGELKFKCALCHSPESWKMRTDSAFDHSVTGFPLTGQHKNIACAGCHENLVFTKKETACVTCHADVHKKELGPNCARCHTTVTWLIPDMKEKHEQTRFPLQGKHLVADCDECHNRQSPNRYAGTPTECISCHQSEYLSTTAPPHVANGFGTNCALCHNVTALSWPGAFDHSTTGFPLLGAHQSLQCSSCHRNNQFTNIPATCFNCHSQDFTGAQNPNHTAGGFSHDCTTCHNLAAWSPATFDHNSTHFALTGAHLAQPCQACHVGGDYHIVYQSCYQCHQTDYQGTTNPNHASFNYSHDCQTCHNTVSWSGVTFDHNTTGFPLTGAHVSIQCTACHVNSNYNLTYSSCYQCHQADYQATNDPNHVALNYSHNCDNCHNTTSWDNATIDHSTTGFPLTGAHVALVCSSCHTNNNFNLTYSDCYQCHQTDYVRPTDPNHTAASFSHDCTGCHSTTVWTGGTFNHSTTAFSLTGAHTSLNCGSCHINQNYQIHYTGCYTCHAADYNGTTNPIHSAAGFPTTCETCHNTTSWAGATFNHTWFPLTHGNAQGVCSTCHTNPLDYSVFQCTVCHTQSQTATQHVGISGYVWNSTNCYQCHPTGGGG